MERSAAFLISLVLVVVPASSTASPLAGAFEHRSSGPISLEQLDDVEMENVEGTLGPAAILGIEVVIGAITGASKNVIDQMSETGEIKAGPAAVAAVYGAAFAAAHGGAALTGSVQVMATVLGLDLAIYAAVKFAEKPDMAEGPPEDLSTSFIDDFDAERFEFNVTRYEAGLHIPLDLDLVPLGAYSHTIHNMPGYVESGYIPAGGFYVGSGPGDPYIGFSDVPTIDGLGGGVGGGAGESHYRYF